jgi:hypothetical protein
MAAQDYKFEGWLGKGPESANGKMEWGEVSVDWKLVFEYRIWQ